MRLLYARHDNVHERQISKEQDFRAKVHNTALQVNYRDSATYQKKSLMTCRTNTMTFFMEEGLVK